MNLSNYEVVTTRVLNFPRQSVYKAWINPNHLKNWWSPKGFTNTFHEFDLRVGGKWKFIMHWPDEKNYPNESEFVEIIEPELLVFNHLSNPVFQVRTEFEDVTSVSTKVTFRMIFPSQELFDALKNYVPEKTKKILIGWKLSCKK